MPYVTDEKQIDDIFAEIIRREQEIYGYQLNINKYTEMEQVLPKTWPAELIKFRKLGRDEIADAVGAENALQVSDLIYHDQVVRALITEQIAQRQVQHLLDASIIQLDPTTLEAKRAALNDASVPA